MSSSSSSSKSSKSSKAILSMRVSMESLVCMDQQMPLQVAVARSVA